jgi:hypothetical protein
MHDVKLPSGRNPFVGFQDSTARRHVRYDAMTGGLGALQGNDERFRIKRRRASRQV